MKRREFVAASATAAGASLLGVNATAETLVRRRAAPVEQINVGVIGAGSRGKYMMRLFLRKPEVRITALCDVYEPRFAEAREITGEDTPGYSDYRQMLDSASDLDAVIVASPLSFHGEHMVASLQSGLHVYGEKAMGFTVDDCNAIVSAVQESGCRFQTGLQYRYAPWYREAIDRIRNGEIGRVTHVYGYWHRNYNWRRPVPDPSLERLINWRLYKEFSGGLLAELGSHQIDVANWIFDEMPTSVIGSGGITFYNDGRETFDNVQAVFTYPSGGTHVFSSIIGNHNVGYQVNIYGTGGSVKLTLEDGAFYYEPARANSAVPQELIERGVNTSATLSTRGDMPYRGPGLPIDIPENEAGNPNFLGAASFIDSVRNDTRPVADEQVGWKSAVAVALGNAAIRGKHYVDIADHLETKE
ncbi:MAG: Gfo/Idh/MocA family oxidoreductase [Gemmatimonadota bacterium]|nr:MAG: Gfo/Idh/MocA family oxidoreductase [Gemmatimonadota bacterium]